MKPINNILLVFCFLLLGFGIGFAQTISTVAGNGTAAYAGDMGQATAAELNQPTGVAIDAAGNLYIADYNNNSIRKITTSGIISTFAGTGTGAYSGDGGQATSAALNYPSGVSFDAAGNLYISDVSNNRIRKVSSAGTISTIAGNGTGGWTGDGGQASLAELFHPFGVGLDAAGNLYIADDGNQRIRKVTASGIMSTIAGTGTAGYTGDGAAATAAELNTPQGVALDAAGNVYIADRNNSRIRLITTSGIISTYAGTGTGGYSGDGMVATAAAINTPAGAVLDAAGNLYIADSGNNRIRKVSAPSSTINTQTTTVTPSSVCADSSAVVTIQSSQSYSTINIIYGLVALTNTTTILGSTQPGTGGSMSFSTGPLTATGNITFAVVGVIVGTATTVVTPSPYVTVTVNPLPPVVITASSATVCMGGSITLTAGGAATYSWSTGAITTATTVTPTATTMYEVVGKSTTGCTDTAFQIITVTTCTNVITNGCVNPGFENGTTSNWIFQQATANGSNLPCPTCFSLSIAGGVYEVTSLGGNSLANTNAGNNTGGDASASCSCSLCGNEPYSGGLDYYGGFPVVAPAPLGGVHSLLLNNSNCGYLMQKAQYKFVVDASSTSFTYQYALVLQSGGHPANTQPYFALDVKNLTTSSTFPCAAYDVNPPSSGNLPGWSISTLDASVYYKPWSTVILDFSSMIGDTVSINFTVSDCGAGGHFGYAYIDANCNPNQINVSNTLCNGGNTLLQGIPGMATYNWAGPVTGTSQNLITNAPGTYTLTTSSGTSCPASNFYYNLTQSPGTSPTISLHPTSNSVCIGTADVLTASGATTYTWSSNAGSAHTNTVSVSPTNSSTYTVIGKDTTTGCGNFSMQAITVNPLPILTIAASSVTVCAGNTTTLTAGGASTYTWNTGPTTTSITPSPTVTTTYSVTGTNTVTGCMKTAITTVTVNPLPPVIVNSPTICIGGTATLTASGASTYTWSTGATTVSTTATPSVTAHYTVTGTSICGVSNTATSTVTVISAPPVIAAIGGGALAVCVGSITPSFTDATVGGAWSITNGTGSATISAGGMVTGVSSGAVTVTYAVTNACGTTTATHALTVNPLPSVAVSVSTSTVCLGGSSVLTASGANTYTWSTGVIGGSITASPTITTTYSVSNTNTVTGCMKTAITTITVNPLPPVMVNSSTICAGGTATLTAAGGITYTWSTGATTVSITPSPTVTTHFTVTGTGVCGVSNTATATSTVTVNNCASTCVTFNANGTWTVPASVCTATVYCWGGGGGGGGSVTGAKFANGGGGGGGACAINNAILVNAGQTYTITIGAGGTAGTTAGTNGGTGGTSIFTGVGGAITANGGTGGVGSTATGGAHAGGAGATTGTGTTIYSGGSGSAGNDGISSTTGITGTGGGGAGTGGNGTTPASACGVAGTGGTGTYFGGNGGYNTDCNTTTNLAGIAGSAPGGGGSGANCWTSSIGGGIGGSGQVIVCYTTPTTITANVTPTTQTLCANSTPTNLSLAVIGGGISYQWYSNSTNSNSGGSNISGAIGNTYTPLTTVGITYYYCVVTGSCGSAISTAVQVVVNPLPPVTITTTTNTICIGNSATLTASGAATYSWSTGAGVTTTTITVTPTVTTMYEVVGKSTTGCTDTAFQTITVINCSPINTNYTLIINPTVICVGDSAIVTLSGSQLGVYYGLVSSVNTNTIVGNAQYSTSGDSLHFPTGALAVAGIFTYYVGGTTTTNTVVVPMNSYVTLTVNPLPTISISANPSTSVCAGNSATLTASGGSSYIWSSGTTYAIVVSPTVTSTYIVIGTGTNSCLNSAMQAIAVNPLPTISVNSDTLCLGDSVLLKAHGAITYTWIPTSGLSSLTGSVVVANPTISMSYTVAGIDSSNCKNIAISNITVVTDNSVFCLGLSTGIVKVNNAFSPNGDGLNETFSIDSIANFPDNHVYIYNRWGQLVWDKPHYNNTTIVWDGKLQNGSTLYAGTYFYIVEVSGQKNLKGWVELTK